MRKLRLAIFLPAFQGILEVVLWYSRRALKLGPLYEDAFPRHPAASLSFGLNAPATILTLLVNEFIDWFTRFLRPQWSGTLPTSELTLILSIIAIWYLIGRWLDLRMAAANSHTKDPRLTVAGVIARLFLLVLGAFFLALSLHDVASSFVEIIARAMLQTWAVFLLVGPGMDFTRWLVTRYRQRNPTHSTAFDFRVLRPISNVQLLLMVISTFLALAALGSFSALRWR
jgi:hypothetical protein